MVIEVIERKWQEAQEQNRLLQMDAVDAASAPHNYSGFDEFLHDEVRLSACLLNGNVGWLIVVLVALGVV